ncbi:HAD family hydrolase [Microbacterium sp. LjRoot45]
MDGILLLRVPPMRDGALRFRVCDAPGAASSRRRSATEEPFSGASRSAIAEVSTLAGPCPIRQPESVSASSPRRAVFLDLDGTIMTANGAIPLSARRALALAREAGHALILSTGRSAAQVPQEVRDLEFDAVITGSGWRIELPDGQRLHDAQFDPRTVAEIVGMLRATGIRFYFETHHGLVVDNDVRSALQRLFAVVADEAGRAHWEHFFVTGLASAAPDIPDQVTKLVCLAGPEWNPSLPAGVRRLPTSIPQLADHLTELMPDDVHKGAAMQIALDWLGLPRTAAIAVGDGENDIEMLSMAGRGIAMGGANDTVRAAADWVAPAAENHGLWMALRSAHALGSD